jgi:hypothetical protein
LKLKWGNGTINHVLSTAASNIESSTSTTTPRSITYIIEMEGKDGR